MLLELLRRTGIAANFFGMDKSAAEICAFVNQYAPDMVFISCTTTECMPAALELVRALMAQSPRLTIIGGGVSALMQRTELLEAGATEICGSRGEVRHAVRLYALRRSVSRSSQVSTVRPLPDTRIANS
jgi:methylmalonyl-CoA mutase cobalamin-binding subunit